MAAAVAFVLTDWLYAHLPTIPWTAIPTLVMLSLAEFVAAYHVRRRIQRKAGTAAVEPLSIARLFALARASTVFGAAAAGVFAGVALALLDRLQAAAVRIDALVASGTLLAALALLAAGVVLEYACRVPDDTAEDGTPAG